MGDLEKAIAEYQKSIEVQENASAYYNIGVCKYQERMLMHSRRGPRRRDQRMERGAASVARQP